MRRNYIKQLDFHLFTNFGKRYLTVYYYRNGEHHHYTLSSVPKWVKDEKTVRKYLNN